MSDYPSKWEELTPEQQAALVEFGKRLAEGMRKLADAFNQLTAAAVEAHRQVEAARAAWDSETEWPTRPHLTDPPDWDAIATRPEPGDSP